MVKGKKKVKSNKIEKSYDSLKPHRTISLTIETSDSDWSVASIDVDKDTWNHPKLKPQIEKLLATLIAVMIEAGVTSSSEVGYISVEVPKADAPSMKTFALQSLRNANFAKTLEPASVPPPVPIPEQVDEKKSESKSDDD